MNNNNNNNNNNIKKTLLLAQPFEFEKKEESIASPTITTTSKKEQVTPTDVVDDAELLAILGIPPPFVTPTVVLDWDDMPELSESDSDEFIDSKKRKHSDDEDDDLFADFDFEPTIIEPLTKKRAFVEEKDITSFSDDILSIVNEEDMLLACELTSS